MSNINIKLYGLNGTVPGVTGVTGPTGPTYTWNNGLTGTTTCKTSVMYRKEFMITRTVAFTFTIENDLILVKESNQNWIYIKFDDNGNICSDLDPRVKGLPDQVKKECLRLFNTMSMK